MTSPHFQEHNASEITEELDVSVVIKVETVVCWWKQVDKKYQFHRGRRSKGRRCVTATIISVRTNGATGQALLFGSE